MINFASGINQYNIEYLLTLQTLFLAALLVTTNKRKFLAMTVASLWKALDRAGCGKYVDIRGLLNHHNNNSSNVDNLCQNRKNKEKCTTAITTTNSLMINPWNYNNQFNKKQSSNNNNNILQNIEQAPTLAIDLSIWICESLTSTAMLNHHANPSLYLVYTRIVKLLSLGIKLIVVMEGKRRRIVVDNDDNDNDDENDDNKIINDNFTNKNDYRHKKNTITKITTKFNKRRSGTKFWKAMQNCKELLKFLGVPIVHAKTEGEALCALLNQRGIVDGVISNDGDCLLFGAKVLYTKFSVENLEQGNVIRYDSTNICAYVDYDDDDDNNNNNKKNNSMAMIKQNYPQSINNNNNIVNLSREDLIAFAVLTGSDLAGNGLPKVGCKKAIRFLKKCQIDNPLTRKMAAINELKSWAKAAAVTTTTIVTTGSARDNTKHMEDQNTKEETSTNEKSTMEPQQQQQQQQKQQHHCSSCSHPGTKRSHQNNGCTLCGTKPGEPCIIVSPGSRFRKKLRAKALAMQQPKFDPAMVVETYQQPNDNQIPISLVGKTARNIEMDLPRLRDLLRSSLIVKGRSLETSREYIRQSLSRLVARMDLLNSAKNSNHNDNDEYKYTSTKKMHLSTNKPIPKMITKRLKRGNDDCFEILWSVQGTITDEDGNCIDGHEFLTIEFEELIKKCHPHLLKSFDVAEKERNKQGDTEQTRRRKFLESFLQGPTNVLGLSSYDDDVAAVMEYRRSREKERGGRQQVQHRSSFFENEKVQNHKTSKLKQINNSLTAGNDLIDCNNKQEIMVDPVERVSNRCNGYRHKDSTRITNNKETYQENNINIHSQQSKSHECQPIGRCNFKRNKSVPHKTRTKRRNNASKSRGRIVGGDDVKQILQTALPNILESNRIDFDFSSIESGSSLATDNNYDDNDDDIVRRRTKQSLKDESSGNETEEKDPELSNLTPSHLYFLGESTNDEDRLYNLCIRQRMKHDINGDDNTRSILSQAYISKNIVSSVRRDVESSALTPGHLHFLKSAVDGKEQGYQVRKRKRERATELADIGAGPRHLMLLDMEPKQSHQFEDAKAIVYKSDDEDESRVRYEKENFPKYCDQIQTTMTNHQKEWGKHRKYHLSTLCGCLENEILDPEAQKIQTNLEHWNLHAGGQPTHYPFTDSSQDEECGEPRGSRLRFDYKSHVNFLDYNDSERPKSMRRESIAFQETTNDFDGEQGRYRSYDNLRSTRSGRPIFTNSNKGESKACRRQKRKKTMKLHKEYSPRRNSVQSLELLNHRHDSVHTHPCMMKDCQFDSKQTHHPRKRRSYHCGLNFEYLAEHVDETLSSNDPALTDVEFRHVDPLTDAPHLSELHEGIQEILKISSQQEDALDSMSEAVLFDQYRLKCPFISPYRHVYDKRGRGRLLGVDFLERHLNTDSQSDHDLNGSWDVPRYVYTDSSLENLFDTCIRTETHDADRRQLGDIEVCTSSESFCHGSHLEPHDETGTIQVEHGLDLLDHVVVCPKGPMNEIHMDTSWEKEETKNYSYYPCSDINRKSKLRR